MTEHFQIVDKPPTEREIILCITATCELSDGLIKQGLLRELTSLLARINNPLVLVPPADHSMVPSAECKSE